jgi:D-xylose transport system substrate-binding protein
MAVRASARRVLSRAVAVVATIVGAVALMTGCSAPADSEGTIALLLPDAKTARYETFDRPFFEARVSELGDFRVLYANADQDAQKQQQQAESALVSGAKVLVLDPVDVQAAVSIVLAANAQDVPVISYDRLVAGGELAYYVSFDNEKVGRLQAEAFVEALEDRGDGGGGILMVNGSPTDSNATSFAVGARAVLERSDLMILAEYATPDWSPDKAQEWVTGQISQFGTRIVGVYAANDGTASGAVSALKAAGADPWPIITGQDAELTAIQRILSGDQYMTVYKAIQPQAELAAEVAVALIRGEEITAPLEIEGTPATLLDPVSVRAGDILETVVADGFWSIDDICTPTYRAACVSVGLLPE